MNHSHARNSYLSPCRMLSGTGEIVPANALPSIPSPLHPLITAGGGPCPWTPWGSYCGPGTRGPWFGSPAGAGPGPGRACTARVVPGLWSESAVGQPFAHVCRPRCPAQGERQPVAYIFLFFFCPVGSSLASPFLLKSQVGRLQV